MNKFLIKKLDSIEVIKEKCQQLQLLGAKNIIVSLGEKGAFMLTSDNKSFLVPAQTINLVSSVGSGDSLVAGFIYMFKQSNDYLKSLKFAVACGTASASIPYIASKELVFSFFKD